MSDIEDRQPRTVGELFAPLFDVLNAGLRSADEVAQATDALRRALLEASRTPLRRDADSGRRIVRSPGSLDSPPR